MAALKASVEAAKSRKSDTAGSDASSDEESAEPARRRRAS
jgi:hypothetical protein